MTSALRDVRFAWRTIWRSRGFSAAAILLLAIGIGATTALFSLVDAVLLRPLPFKEPHRLVEIWGRDDQRTGMRVPATVLEAMRARATTLQAVGTHDPFGGALRRSEGDIAISGETVSANFVEVFGVQPLFGRGFLPEEERGGASAVMLVSHAFWQRYLGSDTTAVGRAVSLDNVPYTVVGIMPRAFRTTFARDAATFWTPYAGNTSRVRERELGYEVVARLAPAATVESARRELELITASLGAAGFSRPGARIGLAPLREEIVGNRAYALQVLFAAVAIVLAMTCANLAQLLLARSDRRVGEFATRKAIGGGAGAVFRLALFENLLLSLAGGAGGVAIAYWLLPAMLALAPIEIPRLVDAAIDGRVLAFAVAVSVVTGGIFGVTPALRLSRLPLIEAMKITAVRAPGGRARFRSALVVVQVAAAVSLLAIGGLVVQTFLTLLPSSPGFATRSRAAFVWNVNERQFSDVVDRRRRVDDMIQRLGNVPGIEAVAVASGIPFGDDEPRNVAVRRPDEHGPLTEAALRTDLRAVSANFFALLQMPILQGRSFAAGDRGDASRVAIVNQTLARRLDASGRVLGTAIRLGSAATAPLYEIVGVVGDTRWWGMTLDPLNEVYVPIEQDRASFGFVVVQSSLGTAALTETMRAAFYAAMPGASLPPERRAVTLDEMIGRSIAGPRFSATLLASFSGLALTLATIGLFGLVAYSVSQRRRELGIRTSLGARPLDLVATTVRSAVVLTAAGVMIGLGLAAYATRFVASQLYGIEPLDARTFALAAIVMLAAAAIAAYVPARRAAHADPMTALRYG